MSKIKTELKKKLQESVNAHQNILKISKDIIEVIENIKKK